MCVWRACVRACECVRACVRACATRASIAFSFFWLTPVSMRAHLSVVCMRVCVAARARIYAYCFRVNCCCVAV